MEFTRESRVVWLSECGCYRIAAAGRYPRLVYSASYRAAGSPVYHQLGLFSQGDARANAAAARQACHQHQRENHAD